MRKKRFVILVSGSGTNMENLIRKVHAGVLDAEVPVVICDRRGAGAIDRAAKLGVPAAVLDRKQFADRAAFEAEMIRVIEEAGADYVVLAGFMRILSNDFVIRFWGRIINVHPSLLPAFPGAHGIRDAFEAKALETGVTVHFVDTGVDTGPVILQRRVPVTPGDTLETLEAKVHAVEYEIYPEALERVLSGKAVMAGPPPGQKA